MAQNGFAGLRWATPQILPYVGELASPNPSPPRTELRSFTTSITTSLIPLRRNPYCIPSFADSRLQHLRSGAYRITISLLGSEGMGTP